MPYVLGKDCKLFRGAYGATANIEVTNVRNLNLNMTKGSSDVTTRGVARAGFRAKAPGLKEGTTTFDMVYDPADADFAAVESAYMTDTPIAFFVTDGQGNGLDADFIILTFSEPQNLEEAVIVSVTAEPTNTRAPVFVRDSGATLGGSVSLSGTAQSGETLTVALTSVTPSGAQTGGSLRWYRNATEITAAAGLTAYELTASEVGTVVSVVYTHPAYAGSLTAATATLVTA